MKCNASHIDLHFFIQMIPNTLLKCLWRALSYILLHTSNLQRSALMGYLRTDTLIYNTFKYNYQPLKPGVPLTIKWSFQFLMPRVIRFQFNFLDPPACSTFGYQQHLRRYNWPRCLSCRFSCHSVDSKYKIYLLLIKLRAAQRAGSK